MLGLLLDMVVLAGALRLVLGDEAPDWQHIFFVVLGVVAANFAIGLAAGLLLPSAVMMYVLLPVGLLVTGVVFAFAFQLTIKQAAVVLGIFFAYELVFQAMISKLF
jgi:hypothetical protein